MEDILFLPNKLRWFVVVVDVIAAIFFMFVSAGVSEKIKGNVRTILVRIK